MVKAEDAGWLVSSASGWEKPKLFSAGYYVEYGLTGRVEKKCRALFSGDPGELVGWRAR